MHLAGYSFESSIPDSAPADANAGSLTFLMEAPDFGMLFTGDLAGEGEEAVCREQIACDILKVAHHGSKYSSTEAFLQRTGAKAALISVGRGNTYGHPAKETLERLQDAKIRSFTTEDCGALTVAARKGKTVIEGYRRLQRRDP